MRKFGLVLAVLTLAVLVSSVQAAKDEDVVGTWVVEKSEEGPPKGTTIEFTKDGKIKATIEEGGQKQVIEGTWKLDKDKLAVIFKVGDKEDKEELTVTEVTKDKLVVKDKKGKATEMKKK